MTCGLGGVNTPQACRVFMPIELEHEIERIDLRAEIEIARGRHDTR